MTTNPYADVIAVTGVIGSGKTSCCKALAKTGAFVLDADKLARDVLTIGIPAYNSALNSFGNEILSDDKNSFTLLA